MPSTLVVRRSSIDGLPNLEAAQRMAELVEPGCEVLGRGLRRAPPAPAWLCLPTSGSWAEAVSGVPENLELASW